MMWEHKMVMGEHKRVGREFLELVLKCGEGSQAPADYSVCVCVW